MHTSYIATNKPMFQVKVMKTTIKHDKDSSTTVRHDIKIKMLEKEQFE